MHENIMFVSHDPINKTCHPCGKAYQLQHELVNHNKKNHLTKWLMIIYFCIVCF